MLIGLANKVMVWVRVEDKVMTKVPVTVTIRVGDQKTKTRDYCVSEWIMKSHY